MKEVFRIGYEYQVFVPLYYLKNSSNNEIVEFNQGEMLDYRFKTAQEFAFNGIKVDYETGTTGIDKLKSEFNAYIEVIDLSDGGTLYRLKDNADVSSIVDNMKNSFPSEVSSILTNEEILRDCFRGRKLS